MGHASTAPSERPGGVGEAGTHAVVIGGSMAGLLATRVLAGHVARVSVLDRDRFPKDLTYHAAESVAGGEPEQFPTPWLKR